MNLKCDDMCAATTGSLFCRMGQVAALLLACVRKVGRVVSLALACVTVLPSFAAENAYVSVSADKGKVVCCGSMFLVIPSNPS